MSNLGRREHWDNVYLTKGEAEVSWFQDSPAVSLELIRSAGTTSDSAIIDIGGGVSRLVDALLDAGHNAVTVLDVSQSALSAVKRRLGTRASRVKWIVADVT